MSSGISRRNLVKAVGSGVIGAAASTVGCGPKPIRVNLICHGMMLFLYDKHDENRFTILIPKPPMDGAGNPLHEISLTAAVGKTKHIDGNLLRDSNEMYRLGHYELKLGSGQKFNQAHSCFSSGPDSTTEVVFYDSDHPGNALIVNSGYVWFRIQVPFPTCVFPVRAMTFPEKDAYRETNTVGYFKVKPGQMGGAHILTYEAASGPVTVGYGDGGSPVEIPANGEWLNLHLYSQALTPAQMGMSHIEAFNNMLDYKDLSAGTQKHFDLATGDCRHAGHPYSSLPSPLDQEITFRDLENLAEQPENVEKTGGMKADAIVRLVSLDPVECLQGFGT